MKSPLIATDRTEVPESVELIFEAVCGLLRVHVLRSEKETRFIILKLDPESGDFEFGLTANDLEQVAKLLAVVAQFFGEIAEGQLGDELGCLSHSLSIALGFDLDECVVRKQERAVK